MGQANFTSVSSLIFSWTDFCVMRHFKIPTVQGHKDCLWGRYWICSSGGGFEQVWLAYYVWNSSSSVISSISMCALLHSMLIIYSNMMSQDMYWEPFPRWKLWWHNMVEVIKHIYRKWEGKVLGTGRQRKHCKLMGCQRGRAETRERTLSVNWPGFSLPMASWIQHCMGEH